MSLLPPGPRSPAFWQTYRFVMSPASYTRELQQEYGDAIRFDAFIGRGIAVLDPALAREVFAAPPETFETPALLPSLFGAHAVIAVAGEPHKRLRKLLNPRFHGAQVRGFLAAMQRAIRAHLEDFERAARTGEVVVLTSVTQAMALDVIIETVFGAGDLDHARARQVLHEMVAAFSPTLAGGATLHKPWFPPYRKYVAARATFDAWVDEVVAARRRRGDDALGDDILGVLLAARYDDGEGMSSPELRDQLVTLLLAGHETSAIGMAWGVYHLVRNPEKLALLRREIDALGPEPTPEALVKSKYLDAVVSESLRIEPIVTDVLRICRQPFTVGKWQLDPGHAVAVMVASILRDERVYERPGEFRPERFLDKRYSPTEFLPFGGGARRCLGAAFAESELALAIAEIASTWDLELADRQPERAVRRNITMGPKRGVRIQVKGRRPRPAAAS